MPPEETPPSRWSAQVFRWVFWVGVVVAAVAALLLLLGKDSMQLRMAGVLAVLSVIVIGVSLSVRRESATVRAEVEEMLLDELDSLHDDVRNDITAAARATHQALGEKVVTLTDTVEALREEVDTLRSHLEQGAPVPVGSVGAGSSRPAQHSGMVRHTETVQVTTRRTIVDPNEASGTVYGGSGGESLIPGQRHGEWASAAHEWSSSAGSSRGPQRSGDESWTDQLLRERFAGHDRTSGMGRLSERDDVDGIRGVGAGDRWASVRSDERGHELRVGERRAEVHSDELGTEMRIQDRWAAVLRDAEHDDTRRESERSFDGFRTHNSGGGSVWGPGRAALPASPAEPASSHFGASWGGRAEPERVSTQYPAPSASSSRWTRPDDQGPDDHRRSLYDEDDWRGRESYGRREDGRREDGRREDSRRDDDGDSRWR